MAWSSGTYTRTNGTYSGAAVWTSDAAAAVKIRADRHDTHDQDLAQGINSCLNKNGENSPTANIAWGGFKITGLAAGVSSTDAANYGQTITAFAFDSGTNIVTATRAAGNLTVDLSALAGGGGGGGAPTDAYYIVSQADGTLTNERVLSASNGVGLTLSAGSAALGLTTTGVSAGTYDLATITVDSRGRITAASTGSVSGTGTVTSVNVSSSSAAAITVSGGPITTSGTITLTVDAGLASIAGLTTAANKMIYTTASDTYAVADLTAAGRALLDDADASAQRTTLGLGTIATQAASAVAITGGTIAGITDLAVADGGTGASTAAAARTNLGLGTWATKAQTVSTSDPSGTPADGDVWLKYTP